MFKPANKSQGAMQSFLAIAEKYLGNPRLYTFARAQPVTVGHHMLAYIEALGRDHERFSVVAKHASSRPLGSGAIAGSTLPLDREYTAKVLGFVDGGNACLTANGMDAVADRILNLLLLAP